MPRRRRIIQLILAAAFLSIASLVAISQPATATERPPNIVVIFIDDMGYGDIGPFGAKGYATPNLDRMAKEGRTFTDFYVTQAVCSASRAGLLTGCYNVRVGILGALLAFLGIRAKSEFPSLAGSALAIAGVISTVGLSMFPFILPSSLDPNSSLTVWDSSSSHFTLFFMLIVTVVFLPIVLLYTGWVFKVLWGRLSTEEATSPSSY